MQGVQQQILPAVMNCDLALHKPHCCRCALGLLVQMDGSLVCVPAAHSPQTRSDKVVRNLKQWQKVCSLRNTFTKMLL